jgi:hypothetical protein
VLIGKKPLRALFETWASLRAAKARFLPPARTRSYARAVN